MMQFLVERERIDVLKSTCALRDLGENHGSKSQQLIQSVPRFFTGEWAGRFSANFVAGIVTNHKQKILSRRISPRVNVDYTSNTDET